MRVLSILITLIILLNQHAIAQTTNVNSNQNKTVMTMRKASMGEDLFSGIYGNGDVIVRDGNSLYKFKITPEQISTLVNTFNSNHFFTMPRFYPSVDSDPYAETHTVTLTFNNKSVVAKSPNPEFLTIVKEFDAILNSPTANAAKEAAKNNKTYEFVGDYMILISGDIVYFSGFTPSDNSQGIFLIPDNKINQLSTNNLSTGRCEGTQRYRAMIYSNDKWIFPPEDEVCINNELISLIKQSTIKMNE